MPRIGGSTHGESRVRMLRLVRKGDRHDPHDLTASLRFEGDFAAAFTGGRQAGVVPGEALKNLVHTVARQHTIGEIESYGLDLCARVLETHPQITKVRADISEQPWQRMESGGKAQGQAFLLAGPELRTAAITSNGTQIAVVSGIDNLTVMRTAGFRPARPRGGRRRRGGRRGAGAAGRRLAGGALDLQHSRRHVRRLPPRRARGDHRNDRAPRRPFDPAHALRDRRRRPGVVPGDLRRVAGDARAPVPPG
jgi:hypothetical protein